jgi:uncharacterized protein YggE
MDLRGSIMNNFRSILFVLGILAISAASALASDGSQRTITVNGQGKASAPPDMAIIETGVVTHGVTAIEALSENNQIMGRIMDILIGHKIAEKDVQTSMLNVIPEYKQDDRGRIEEKIIGYSVRNQVQVRVRDLKYLGQVIDALVRAGSNQVSGISFGIDDPARVINQARERAIADARGRAELYARSAGVREGKILAINEQATEWPRAQGAYRMYDMQAVSSVPVATGEQEYSVTIQMIFTLENTE